MLPPELLKDTSGALSRDDLDALMLANVLFHDMVLRDFAKDPLRHFEALKVHGHHSYELVITEGNEYRCGDIDDFSRRLRLGHVGELDFVATLFDENIFKELLPHKDAWRDARVETPYSFASESLFERAYSELLFCKSMNGVTYVDGQLSQPYLSLPAVRECTSLEIIELPSPLSMLEVVEWLNADARSKEPKYLKMDDDDLSDSVENLVQQLKTVSVGSSEDIF